MKEFERELKELIIESLMLENIDVDDIDAEEPLFREGLGLDSIDALELAISIHKRYDVKIEADDERNREVFASVRSLAKFIASRRHEDQAAEPGAVSEEAAR